MKRSLVGLSLFLGSLPVVGCAAQDDAGKSEDAIMNAMPASEYAEAVTIDFVKDGQSYLCSGALIAPKVVLTAGHCAAGGATAFMVRAGNSSTFTMASTTLDYVDTTEHVNLGEHDVALVLLTDPIVLPRYASVATNPVPSGTTLTNVGRIQDGIATNNLFKASGVVSLDPSAPYDYLSTQIIQPGDSGGPDFIAGTHVIAAVNSGTADSVKLEYLARVDLVHDWIMQQIALHGGGGGSPTAGLIPTETLNSVSRFDIVATELNCRSGPGTNNPVLAQLFSGQTVDAAPGPRVAYALDGAPWVMVTPPGAGACYISGKYEFIQPVPDAPAPGGGGGRMPGSTELVVSPGLYGSLALAVHGSTVTGSVRDSGCEFTLAGSLSGVNPIPVNIATGSANITGTLQIIDASNVALSAPKLSSVCAAVVPQAFSGATIPFRQAISANVFGFRTVKSYRTWFHDGPGSPANGKFVITGQTVQQLSENQGGFVQVRYNDGINPSTVGWVAETDLFDLQIPNTSL